jgi:hypothetical protein
MSGNYINSCVSYTAALALTEYLDTLLTAVCSLIELTGQVLDCEYAVSLTYSGHLLINEVNGRLGENSADSSLEILLAELVSIVAVEYPKAGKVKSQGSPYITEHRLGLNGELRLLFNINSEYGHNSALLIY